MPGQVVFWIMFGIGKLSASLKKVIPRKALIGKERYFGYFLAAV